MFHGIDEMATANALIIYKLFHPEEANMYVERLEDSPIPNLRVIRSNDTFEGHTVKKYDQFVGEGRTHQRVRKTCIYCPTKLPNGQRNRSNYTSHWCPACIVFLHDQCFAGYYRDKGYQLVNGTFFSPPK